jgi:16S rRNA (guanine527-N7)-methyltransferase
MRELCERYALSGEQGDALWQLLELLARDEYAPTAVRSRDRAVDLHVADSLAGLELEEVRLARAVADIGSGAGFPGLALAIALPGSEVDLVESQARRCAFLERAVAETGIANAAVVCARAEEWQEGSERHDLVVARALAPLAVVLEYAAPLLAVGGWLVDWRGARARAQEREAAVAASELGLQPMRVKPVEPFPGVRHRNLHLYLKVRSTSARYPRRPGVAVRRPLGRSQSTSA